MDVTSIFVENKFKHDVLYRTFYRVSERRKYYLGTTVQFVECINVSLRETLAKVEYWMSKYEKDVEKINLRIAMKRGDYEQICERKRKLEDVYEEHAIAINDWVTFTEERKRVRQYEKKMNSSAIIIQAWWRGLLVRQQLGPYKIVKKRVAAPKPNKK